MPNSDESKHSLKLRLKIAVISLLGLLVPSACAPPPMCYVPPPPTDTSTPFVTCYTAPAPTPTPTSTTFTSSISPLPTPTPTPEARRLLRDKLLAEGRFPQNIARELEA